MTPLYTYRCKLVRVIDGDTIVVDIDLGLNVWQHNQYIRLAGINTPEIRGPERTRGLLAKTYVERALSPDVHIVMETFKGKEKGKYGRWLGVIWYLKNNEMIDLNKELVEKKLAEVWT